MSTLQTEIQQHFRFANRGMPDLQGWINLKAIQACTIEPWEGGTTKYWYHSCSHWILWNSRFIERALWHILRAANVLYFIKPNQLALGFYVFDVLWHWDNFLTVCLTVLPTFILLKFPWFLNYNKYIWSIYFLCEGAQLLGCA